MKNWIMTLKILALGLSALIAVFHFNSKSAEPFQPEFKLGVDYQQLTDNKDNSDLELSSSNLIEVFYWYGCDACYLTESLLADYLKGKPDVNLVRIPLVARLNWREQAYLQPLMEQLVVNSEISYLDVYKQCMEDCQVFSNFDTSLTWLKSKLEDKPELIIDQSLIWQAEKNYRKRAEIFSIAQVPTIIINGKYKVDANHAGTAERLIEIVDFLLSQ